MLRACYTTFPAMRCSFQFMYDSEPTPCIAEKSNLSVVISVCSVSTHSELGLVDMLEKPMQRFQIVITQCKMYERPCTLAKFCQSLFLDDMTHIDFGVFIHRGHVMVLFCRVGGLHIDHLSKTFDQTVSQTLVQTTTDQPTRIWCRVERKACFLPPLALNSPHPSRTYLKPFSNARRWYQLILLVVCDGQDAGEPIRKLGRIGWKWAVRSEHSLLEPWCRRSLHAGDEVCSNLQQI